MLLVGVTGLSELGQQNWAGPGTGQNEKGITSAVLVF